MLKIDLHIHTIASGHAQCTILEYIEQAKKLKMKIIGIADHGPGDSETLVSEIYFRMLERIPNKIDNIRVLKGVEANIVNIKGDIDISDKLVEEMDYIMANFHAETSYKNKGIKENTKATINAIRSGKIDIITHPFATERFPIDIGKISDEACKNNVLLEINLSYFFGNKIKDSTVPNAKLMIDIARKHSKKIIIGSDAHNIWELGDDSAFMKKFKKMLGLTNNLIINNYPRELFKLLKINE